MKVRWAALCVAAVMGGGCAPDAWDNVQATGFNAFLDKVTAECQPLYVASLVITRNFQDPAWDLQTNNYYDQWIDQTSRLYYRKISPETYLINVDNFFGAPSRKSAECVVSKLPATSGPPPSRLQ